MKDFDESIMKKLLNSYLNVHGDAYKENEIRMIIDNFGKTNKDYMTQIYYALGMYDDIDNPYVGFVDLIEKAYGLDINILEVGGGIYPALSDCIARRQIKVGKGSVTVFDPLLSRHLNLSGITLEKRNFNEQENVKRYDLIIGKEPCGSTYSIINSAESNNKSLVLSPCKCYGLLPEYMDYDDDPLKQWYEYVKYLIDYHSGKFTTHYLEKSKNYDNPIYNKMR